MKKYNWIKALILNVITCGIYSIVMWYKMDKMGKAMADKAGVVEEKNNWGFIVFAFLLSGVTCGIMAFVWFFKHFKQQVAIAEKVGVELSPTKAPIVLVILMVVPIYSFYVLCDNHNKLVDACEAIA